MAAGTTDNTGTISFSLTPGLYGLQSVIPGYTTWGNSNSVAGQFGIPVEAGYRTDVSVSLGTLEIQLFYAADEPMGGKRVDIFTQRRTITGEVAFNEKVVMLTTDNNGKISYVLSPGSYAFSIDGLAGYGWGNAATGESEVNVVVKSGLVTPKRVMMGLLIIRFVPRIVTPNPIFVKVYTQKKGALDEWVVDRRVASAGTTPGGLVGFALTRGDYAIEFIPPGENRDRKIFSVAIEEGKTTELAF